MNYSEAYGVNDLSHVVGNSAIGLVYSRVSLAQRSDGRSRRVERSGGKSRRARLIIPGSLRVRAISFRSSGNMTSRTPTTRPRIQQLPIPAGFFSATTTAVNDSGDVVGYAGSPNIDSHAVLWRDGMAIDLGVWPGGQLQRCNRINNLGQIVGTGTVAGDNLDHINVMSDRNANPTPTVTISQKYPRVRLPLYRGLA